MRRQLPGPGAGAEPPVSFFVTAGDRPRPSEAQFARPGGAAPIPVPPTAPTATGCTAAGTG